MSVSLVTYEDPVGRSGRITEAVDLLPHDPRRRLDHFCDAVRSSRGWGKDAPLACVYNGAITDPATDGRDLYVTDGDTVILCPKPAGVVEAVLLGIAIVSAAASAFLATKVKAPRISQVEAPERRFGFGRVSNDAFVGDARQVHLGRSRRAGGKVIAKVPVESPDGSGDARLRLLIAYGEGPLKSIAGVASDTNNLPAEGFTGGDGGGLWLNDQPIANFPGARVSVRLGTAGQSVIPGFSDTEILREVGVGGVELRNTSGSERTGTDTAESFTYSTVGTVHEAVVRVRFPAGLSTIAASGQVDTAKVKYRWRWRLNAGPGAWSAWTTVTVTRADQSEFFSSPRTPTLSATPARVDIMVQRVSVEPTTATVVDRMVWDSLTEVTHSANTYPDTPLLALELIAGEQLTGVPAVSADVEGLKNLRVWDGVSSESSPVFVNAYSENPAYYALEILTNPRWGMGGFVALSNVDLPGLVAWARYNDENTLRHDGETNRPRFRAHFTLTEQRDAIEWLRTICRAGRCVPVLVGNQWRFIVDRPQSSPVEVFTDASVAVDESTGLKRLSYRRELGTGGVTRPNRLTAQFENERQNGQPETLAYPDYATLWLATEPVREDTAKIDGVTDPDQVADELVYLMKRSRGLTRTITLVTTRAVVACQPGDRFDAAVSLLGWGTASGRVLAGSTTTAVKLDKSVTLIAGRTYVLRTVRTDHTIEVRTVTSAAGDYAAGANITVSPGFSVTPAEFDEYALGQQSIEVKPFTCTGIKVADAGTLMWEVSGVEYDPQVYDPEPGDITLPDYSELRDAWTPPGPVLTISAHDRMTPRGRVVDLAWTQAPKDAEQTASFRVYRRRVGTGVWMLVPEPKVSRRGAVVEIYETNVGYDFCAVAVSVAGSFLSPSDPRVPIANIVLGLSGDEPEPARSVTITPISGNLYRVAWTWTQTDAPDPVAFALLTGGTYVDPGSPEVRMDGNEQCLVLARTPNLSYDVTLAPGLRHDFFVRSVAASGRMGRTYFGHQFIASPAPPPGQTVRSSRVFNLQTEGAKTNLTWDGTDARLELTNPALPGVWESPEADLTTAALTQLTHRTLTANNAAIPTIAGTLFEAPSLEADQWGVVSRDGGVPVVGMIHPPHPDDTQAWLVELRTFDGTVWTDYAAWDAMTPISRTVRKYRVRVTMTRTKEPYSPALKGFAVVATR